MKNITYSVFFVLLVACGNAVLIPGPQGNTGDTGPTGATGSPGSTGPQGVPGAPGTQVSAVQFCPGYVPTYPTVFPEVGLCINGKLYAEYYAPPSSGLVYIPPGYYSSTQTGAPCNFTVKPNCVVE